MKKERDYRDSLVDILNAIQEIKVFINDRDILAFINNKETLYATVYCLQIIGEAVKNVPEKIRAKYEKVPWREIAGMRDRLIHGYFTVDVERVWQTIKSDLPSLKKAISRILDETK
ncbi:MAG: HepT-like ribonuclease domain-containing protein [Candidatus Ranarchaeia archaeon]